MTTKNNKKSDISPLLEDCPTAYYWIGFLLADGSFTRESKNMKLHISYDDIDHLTKFSHLVGGSISTSTYTSAYGSVKSCTVNCYDALLVPELCRKFDIMARKTFNPPDFSRYSCSPDNMLSLIVGLIDGDGCITKQSNCDGYRITIQMHASWAANLEIINETLNSNFHSMLTTRVVIKNGIAHLAISKKRLLGQLFDFIKTQNLPVLERKWTKLEKLRVCTNVLRAINQSTHPNRKPVTVGDIEFSSITAAAKHFGVGNQTINRWLKKNAG